MEVRKVETELSQTEGSTPVSLQRPTKHQVLCLEHLQIYIALLCPLSVHGLRQNGHDYIWLTLLHYELFIGAATNSSLFPL